MKAQDVIARLDDPQLPLVVDLDGTLMRTDTLWEGLRYVLFHHPLLFVKYLCDFITKKMRGGGGKLSLKWHLTPWVLYGVRTYPFNQEVCTLLRVAAAAGRPVCLATGSTLPIAQEVAKRLGIFTTVFASTRERNLVGEEKARHLVNTYGYKGFDYIGDSRHDIPVWEQARRAYVVGSPPALKKNYPLIRISPINSKAKLRILAKAMRLHQWVKNLLVFVPMIAGHAFTANAFGASILAFFALSFAASAIYVVNDILDIDDDRAHPRKSSRPFASGALPLKYAPLCFVGTITVAFLCASFLSSRFMLFLLGYLLTSIAYSLFLKRLVIIDILVLAWLYVLRIILGIMAINCEFSQWLFFFFFFLFLGLATIKRLGALGKSIPESANLRRGWRDEDKTFLLPFAVGCGIGSTVIFWIYCNSEQAIIHYTYRYYLLAINVIFIYWYQKIVLLVNRGVIHDDPLEYAIRDLRNYPLYFAVIVLFLQSL